MFRIREFRQKKGLLQVQLADKVGITNIYLSRIETGRADPSPKILRRIASELGVTPGELFGVDSQLNSSEGA